MNRELRTFCTLRFKSIALVSIGGEENANYGGKVRLQFGALTMLSHTCARFVDGMNLGRLRVPVSSCADGKVDFARVGRHRIER